MASWARCPCVQGHQGRGGLHREDWAWEGDMSSAVLLTPLKDRCREGHRRQAMGETKGVQTVKHGRRETQWWKGRGTELWKEVGVPAEREGQGVHEWLEIQMWRRSEHQEGLQGFRKGRDANVPSRSTQSPDAANLVVCLQGPCQRPAQTPAGRRPSTGCQRHCS